MLKEFHFDFWTLWGFVGQFIFFMRFVVQWIASERAKKSVVPAAFWYISLVGTVMLIVYAWYRRDVVFICGFGLTIVIYLRNIILIRRHSKRGYLVEPIAAEK